VHLKDDQTAINREIGGDYARIDSRKKEKKVGNRFTRVGVGGLGYPLKRSASNRKRDAKGSQDWSERVPQAADRGIKGQEGAAGDLSVKV
jgi:hypothetical protein